MSEPAPASTPPERPSGGIAAIAGLVPGVVTFVVTVTAFFVAGPRDSMRAIEEAGPALWLVLPCAVIAVIAGGILIALAPRAPVPAAIALALGTWPWLAGLIATAWGMSRASAATAEVEPAMRATLIAEGLAEALFGRVIGGVIGSATLVGLGLGLAIASIAPRAPNRSAIGAGLGLVAGGTPLLAAIAVGALGIGFAGATLIGAVAVFSAIGCAIAGWGAGADLPRARSASLAASAPVAFLLALVCAGGAAGVFPIIEVFAAIANADPGARVELLARFGDEIALPTTIAGSAWAVGLVGCGALAAWAAGRARPTVGRAIGACAALFVAFATIALGAASERSTYALLDVVPSAPWSAVAGFEPVVAPGRRDDRPRLIVATDRIEADGRSAPLAGIEVEGAPRAAALALVRAAVEAHGPEPWWAIEEPEAEGVPSVAIAIDRRVTGAQLRALLALAREAGAGGIRIVGVRERLDPTSVARVPAPFRAIVGSPVVSAVTAGLATDGAEADGRLLHARIVPAHATTAVALEGRPGAEGRAIAADARLEPWAEVPRADHRAYLTIDPTTPAEVVASVVARAIASGLEPVLLAGDEVPGNPSQPAVSQQAASGPGMAQPEVRGSLSREVIQRVVRTHLGEITRCYEEGLAARPEIAGRVLMRWTIAGDGQVVAPTVLETTLGAPWVERCITLAIGRWTFPAPDDGGVVVVDYPFAFTASP